MTSSDWLGARRVLRATQVAGAVVTAATGIALLMGNAGLILVWCMTAILGAVRAFERPAAQAYLPSLVPTEALVNAVAFTGLLTTSTRFFGPAMGALLLVSGGPWLCFVVNSVGFAVVAAFLPRERKERGSRNWVSVRAGLHYIRTDRVLGPVVGIAFVVFMAAFNFPTSLTLFANGTLHGGNAAYGRLMSATGLGALVVVVALAGRPPTGTRAVGVAAIALGGALAVLGTARTELPALGAAVLVGASSTGFAVIVASVLQMRTGDDVRGRVMSVYTLALFGTSAIGGPMTGVLVDLTNPAAELVKVIESNGCYAAA
ncbi:MFS family permease [Rhodococcus sp. 27YEA15]|uniref:MFS transporter n=1 Tax=Rhodococcus sp. 27YEA15 TaxID=3156259 RepID=UPI003C7D1FF9